MDKLAELEKRIKELEQRPIYQYHYHYYTYPQYTQPFQGPNWITNPDISGTAIPYTNGQVGVVGV